jgi:hypothetical protein
MPFSQHMRVRVFANTATVKVRRRRARRKKKEWCLLFRCALTLASPARHCEEPTGPARSGRPDDKLRDEAIQFLDALDCFALLAMTKNKGSGTQRIVLPHAVLLARPLP